MLIGELASRTAVSARALRHYEEVGLLVADRDTNGYRVYSEADILRVQQIKAMIDAGLTASVVRRFLDCARSDDHGATMLKMCPDLQSAVDAASAGFDRQRATLDEKQRRLCALTPSP